MRLKESETVELKQIVVDDIKKEAVAFANSGGGTVYIGVADSGEVIGVENPAEVILQVNNMLRDSIKPDITMFAQSAEETADGKIIVAVTVQRGTERPYYIAAKGLRPEGVFVRHGTASVPATDTAIRRMIKETDGESYEALRSLRQDLTFAAAADEFSRRGVNFGPGQMAALGILNSDKIYTNLGLLLADQCAHSIKVAVFQDDSLRVFKDRREFEGSLFKQLNDAYAFIDLHNPIRATFDKLDRIDVRDYPEDALREALLNTIVHREYAMSSSILVKMFPSRVEFISIGGLLRGIELADILSGYSICRNPRLAAVFYRLRLIEAYGTGMPKIFQAYGDEAPAPDIQVTPNVFKITLPNVNAAPAKPQGGVPAGSPEAQILHLARAKGTA
jgi:ATP-dependent DNA helicase RecG